MKIWSKEFLENEDQFRFVEHYDDGSFQLERKLQVVSRTLARGSRITTREIANSMRGKVP